MVAALEGARYNATVARLIAPAPPGKKIWRSWLTYRARFVEPKRIGWGVEFYNENRDLLNQAAQRRRAGPIIASIIGVETLYGRNMGNFRVLDALTTLAFDYPGPGQTRTRRHVPRPARGFPDAGNAGQLDLETRGSLRRRHRHAAVHAGQHHALCRRRRRQRPYRPDQQHQDAILSVGSFLAQHGWQRGVPVFAPVTLPADPSALVDGGLVPKQSWNTISAAGAACSPAPPPLAGAPIPWASSIWSKKRGTAQYRVGTPNFFALTHYNRSYLRHRRGRPGRRNRSPRRPLNAAGKPPQPEEPAPVEGCFNPGRTEPALPVRRAPLRGEAHSASGAGLTLRSVAAPLRGSAQRFGVN